MAYQVESYIQRVEVENPDVVLGVDISFSDSAVFKPLFSTSDQATSNLKNLLLTRIGERYAQPNFGTELLNLVFMPNTSELKTDIEETIFNAVEFWLPYISIEKIDILTAEDDPSLQHTTKITLTYSVSGYNTKTIIIYAKESGGLLIEEYYAK